MARWEFGGGLADGAWQRAVTSRWRRGHGRVLRQAGRGQGHGSSPFGIDGCAAGEHRSAAWSIYVWKAKIRVEMTPSEPLISYLLTFLSYLWACGLTVLLSLCPYISLRPTARDQRRRRVKMHLG